MSKKPIFEFPTRGSLTIEAAPEPEATPQIVIDELSTPTPDWPPDEFLEAGDWGCGEEPYGHCKPEGNRMGLTVSLSVLRWL